MKLPNGHAAAAAAAARRQQQHTLTHARSFSPSHTHTDTQCTHICRHRQRCAQLDTGSRQRSRHTLATYVSNMRTKLATFSMLPVFQFASSDADADCSRGSIFCQFDLNLCLSCALACAAVVVVLLLLFSRCCCCCYLHLSASRISVSICRLIISGFCLPHSHSRLSLLHGSSSTTSISANTKAFDVGCAVGIPLRLCLYVLLNDKTNRDQ